MEFYKDMKFVFKSYGTILIDEKIVNDKDSPSIVNNIFEWFVILESQPLDHETYPLNHECKIVMNCNKHSNMFEWFVLYVYDDSEYVSGSNSYYSIISKSVSEFLSKLKKWNDDCKKLNSAYNSNEIDFFEYLKNFIKRSRSQI